MPFNGRRYKMMTCRVHTPCRVKRPGNALAASVPGKHAAAWGWGRYKAGTRWRWELPVVSKAEPTGKGSGKTDGRTGIFRSFQ